MGKAAAIASAAFFGSKMLIEGLKKAIELGSKFTAVSKGFNNLARDAGFSANALDKLTKATIHLHNGVPLVASHPDMVCPSLDGDLPDVGAYLSLFKATTGVEPTHICGKPNAGMILHKIEELGLQPSECAMVGDRLYTDMEMAERAGVVGVLVLSGEATIDDLKDVKQNPNTS